MLDVEVFKERVAALWGSQKTMARPKLWKTGKRAGVVRKQAMPVYFDKRALEQWLWKIVGLNAKPCPYCNVPIDILSLTLDHVIPRSAGGEFALDNMQVICKDCNAMKGDLSDDAFRQVLALARTLSGYDQAKLFGRLKAAHHGSPARFFRKPQEQRPAPPASTAGTDASGLGDF
jgi:hypothetical protein